jgi:hypothetical protein
MRPERSAVTAKDVTKRPMVRGRKVPSPVVSIDRGAGLVWRGPDYPVLSAGVYTVRAVLYQGPQWIRSYRRWSLRLEFALVHESISVSAFFNLGDDPEGYKVGRQSRFYKAWVIANGEHPRKGQLMDLDVFLEGQFFQVVVADSGKDAERKAKNPAEVYSIVTQILSSDRHQS